MNYKVVVSQAAEQYLLDIYDYIFGQLLNVVSAERILHKLEHAVLSLSSMPYRYGLYGRGKQYKTLLRCMPVDGFNVFYIVRKNEVEVLRVMSGRRSIKNL